MASLKELIFEFGIEKERLGWFQKVLESAEEQDRTGQPVSKTTKVAYKKVKSLQKKIDNLESQIERLIG